jgi:hypothetical protein
MPVEVNGIFFLNHDSIPAADEDSITDAAINLMKHEYNLCRLICLTVALRLKLNHTN